jgi:hypothetical protein
MGGVFSSSTEVHPVIVNHPEGHSTTVQADLNLDGVSLARVVATELSLAPGTFSLVFGGKRLDNDSKETLFERGFLYTGTEVHLVTSNSPACVQGAR